MTSAAWFLVLATAGALAEFGGVTLIVFDIRDSRRHASRILHRDVTVYPASIHTSTMVSSPTLSAGAQTTEQRLDAVERRIATLDERTTKGLAEARQEMRQVAEDAANRARAAAHDDYVLLRNVLLGQLSGSLGRRTWGIVLLLIGIVLAYAANLISGLASTT